MLYAYIILRFFIFIIQVSRMILFIVVLQFEINIPRFVIFKLLFIIIIILFAYILVWDRII